MRGSWNGRIVGTHIGNVSLKINDEGSAGVLRLKEEGPADVFVFNVKISARDGEKIQVTGNRPNDVPPAGASEFTAVGSIDSDGNFRGEWVASSGAGGDFVFFPSKGEVKTRAGDLDSNTRGGARIRTERFEFGAIRINFEELVKLFDFIQSEFQAPVVVSYKQGIHNIVSLNEFKRTEFEPEVADFVTLSVAEASDFGLNRSVQLDFGQVKNVLLVQGPEENWVSATFEKIKRRVRSKEDRYTSFAKKYVGDINFMFFCFILVYLMGIDDNLQRYYYMTVFVLGILGVTLYNKNLLRSFQCTFGVDAGAGNSGFYQALSSRVGSMFFTLLDALLIWGCIWVIEKYLIAQ
ncbi:MAG: hypothetical protein AXW12_10470 [Thalassospira sp. Nap_22]|nr:MAG: hypothetical protein AXW12_10470 [Thalassospira sp. Nap_22]